MARGVATGRRSTLVRVRAEEPRSSRSTDAAPPPPSSTPPGTSGNQAPLGVITNSAPLAQGREKPVGERIAYICQVCGYVYDEETPFEDVSEDYNCPSKSSNFASSSQTSLDLLSITTRLLSRAKKTICHFVESLISLITPGRRFFRVIAKYCV